MTNKRDFWSLTNSGNGIASDRRPSQYGVNLRWIDRITSHSIPAVSFSYDISFPRFEAMQLIVVPRVMKNVDDFSDSIQYFVVQSVIPFYANAVYPGDILLKACGEKCFNIITRFARDSGPSTVDELVASLAGKSSDQPLQLRFLRLAGKTVNFTPSPAEFALFLSDKYVAAKYVVTVSYPSPSNDGKLQTQATGSVNTLIVDDGPTMIPQDAAVVSLEAIYLVYMEQQVRSSQSTHMLFSKLILVVLNVCTLQLPFSVSQMIQGKHMKWCSIYQLSRNTCAAVSACSYYSLLSSNAATSHGGNLPIMGAHSGDALHTVAPQHCAYSDKSNERPDDDVSVVISKNSLATCIHLLKTGRSCGVSSSNIDSTEDQGRISMGGAYRDVTAKNQRWIALVGAPARSDLLRYYVVGKYDSERLATSVCEQVTYLKQAIPSLSTNRWFAMRCDGRC